MTIVSAANSPFSRWTTSWRSGGTSLRAIACHALGLYHGQSGGRRYRQILSDSSRLKNAGPELFIEALAAVEPVIAETIGD